MMKTMKMNAPSFLRGVRVAGLTARGAEIVMKLIVCLFAASCVIGHPGIQITVTQKGLEYLGGVIIREVTDQLAGKTVSYEISRGANIPTIRVSVNLQKISGVSIPAYNVKSEPGSGIIMSVTDMETKFSGVLTYTISNRRNQEDPEEVTVSATGISLKIAIQISDIDGHPSVDVTCSSIIHHISLLFEPGSPSGEYDPTHKFLEKLFGGQLKKELSPVLCSVFRASVQPLLQAYLNGFNWVAGVGSGMLDMSMVEETTYGEGFIKTSHKGQCPGDDEELEHTNMTTSWDEGMFMTTISKEVPKSILRSQSKYGIVSRSFKATLWPKMVESLGFDWYASGSLFQVMLTNKGDPEIELKSDGIATKLMGNLSFMSLKNREMAADLDVEITGICSVEVSEGDLMLKQTHLKVVVGSDKIPEKSLAGIREALNEELQAVTSQPSVMKFPLPNGLVNNKTTIFYNEHFIKLVTEL